MKKIALLVFVLFMSFALPVAIFAKGGENGDDNSNHDSGEPIMNTTAPVPYDGKCASDAVLAHESAVQKLIDDNNATLKSAASTRGAAIAAAYLLTDQTARNAEILAAVQAFQTSKMSAETTFKTALKTENGTFKTAMLACGATPFKSEGDEENHDMGNGMMGANNGLHLGWFNRSLTHGMKGDDVKKVQDFLGINSDGIFGQMTKSKVMEWQMKKGLTPDGIFGSKSLKELEQEDSNDN